MWSVSCLSSITEMHNFPKIVSWISHYENEDELAKIACIVWSFLKRRNLKVHEGNIKPYETFELALSVLRNYQASWLMKNPPQQKGTNLKPPPIGSFKLNVDGALFFDIQKVCVGFICSDHERRVVLAASIAERNVREPETIEALTFSRSLQLYMH